MDKEIKAIRKENNLVNYTVKELIGGVHTKIDRIEKKLVKGTIIFSEVKKDLGHHKHLIYTLYGCIAALFLILLDLKGVI